MKNRVYITSLYDKSDISDSSGPLTDDIVKAWTFSRKNVLTFVPSTNGLYLNGKKYHSLSDVKNDNTVKTVFRLAILHETNNDTIYNTNYINLIQEQIHQNFNIDSLIIHANYTDNGNGVISLEAQIGERIQLFMNYNGNFIWESSQPECVSIDRNYIIHILKAPISGEVPYLELKYNDTVLFRININIYATINLYDVFSTRNLISQFNDQDTRADYNTVLDDYTIIRTAHDKFNNLMISQESHAARENAEETLNPNQVNP